MKTVAIVWGLAILAVGGAAYYVYKKLGAGALNPANPNNVVNQGATAIVQAFTGDKNQTVGGGLFDWLNADAGLAPGETLVGPGLIRATPPTPSSAQSGTAWSSAAVDFSALGGA